MKKKPLIFLLFFLMVLVVLALLFRGQGRIDWRETYKEGSRDPYGISIIHGLLQNYFAQEPFVEIRKGLTKELPLEKNIAPSNYVFIGEAMFMDSSDTRTLLEFVENGNTAFIASRTIPYDLMFYLYYHECDSNYWEDYYTLQDSVIALSLLHPNLATAAPFEFKYVFKNRTERYAWQFIPERYFCEDPEGLFPIGRMQDSLANFAKIRYGDGDFFLHTTPIAFTNINMLDSLHLGYANRVFSHLRDGPVYWDRYSRVPEIVGRRRNGIARTNRNLYADSPLRYFLSQPPLIWSWYLLIALWLFYLLMRSKRRQRVIPVIEPNTNSSLDFISTIGRLYFMQNNHQKLSMLKMKLFRYFVK